MNFELQNRLKTLYFRHFPRNTKVVQDTIWGLFLYRMPSPVMAAFPKCPKNSISSQFYSIISRKTRKNNVNYIYQ